MFIPFAVAGIAGAWLSSRGKPTASVSKKMCFGAKSGLTYQVDELPETGLILLHYRGSTGVFQRKKDAPGFKWVRGTGNPHVLAAMISDF